MDPKAMLLLLSLTLRIGLGIRDEFNQQEKELLRNKVRRMFYHGYDNYLQHAFPLDELRPISCTGHDTWGSYSLTLIDALDTLLIMGNVSEFVRVSEYLQTHLRFDMDVNVSVFETNIRIVGGLLSAHLLSYYAKEPLHEGWPCKGPLLDLAANVAGRLLPAFDTITGMPYGTVNLKYGVPSGETTITCMACIGSYIVEFGTLSALTGDRRFEVVALRALDALWKSRSEKGLLGNHIDIVSKKWTAMDSGIGAAMDSYFEYLFKGGVLFNNSKLYSMFYEMNEKIHHYVKYDDWYIWVNLNKATITLPVFQSLDGYWPGVQAMAGHIGEASRTMFHYHAVWKMFGFVPEFYQIAVGEPLKGREGYPLRPELAESAYHLYKATGDVFFLRVGRDIIESIEQVTRTPCGYATVKNVGTHQLEDRMESFFLAETTKYLYLLFDEANIINSQTDDLYINHPSSKVPSTCNVGKLGYIFNTEAHPIDIGAVTCCRMFDHESLKYKSMWRVHKNTNSAKEFEFENHKEISEFLMQRESTGYHELTRILNYEENKNFTIRKCKSRPYFQRLFLNGAFENDLDDL